jgi:Regulator of competence-specific genes
MAKQLADHYVDLLADWAPVTTRPLFGAIALYRNDHVFAMIWQGGLYFKVDDTLREEYESAGSRPLGYRSAGRDLALQSYWEVPADVLEDGDRLYRDAEAAYQAALSSSKK